MHFIAAVIGMFDSMLAELPQVEAFDILCRNVHGPEPGQHYAAQILGWGSAIATDAPQILDQTGTIASASSRLRIGVADKTNAKQRGVDWQFHIENARVKLKRLYPKIKA